MNKKDYFRTSDLALTATLRCYNYQIAEIEKINPVKAVFCIEKDEKIDDIVRSYWSHQLLVEPTAFFNYQKELKTRIY
jgi:hypothetical protein